MEDSDRTYVYDAFDCWVRGGYFAETLLDELDDRVQDLVGATSGAFRAALRTWVEGALAAQRDRENGWTEETVNDRIEEAFAELEDSGIAALENAGYTDEDGWADCRERMAGLENARGGVFFHGQDVERGVRGEGLSLSFGGDDPAAIGREICEVLGKYGVPTVWSGDLETRVAIPPFEWRKRAFTSTP